MLNRESTQGEASASAAGLSAPRRKRRQARPVMDFGKSITLIPFSGIQFIDFEFPASDLSSIRRRFFEQPASPQTNHQPVLHPIVMEDGVLLDPLTQTALANENTISVSGSKSIAPFLGHWVPIPLMRVIDAAVAGKAAKLDEGPINWARVHITPSRLDRPAGPAKEGHPATYRVVLALDTNIQTQGRQDGDPYLAPTSVDVALRSTFGFSDNVDDVAWFVSEPWVDAWVSQLFDASTSAGTGTQDGHEADVHNDPGGAGPGDTSAQGGGDLSHLAHYLTMLSVLNELCVLPQIRFLDTADRRTNDAPIKVDLVVDYGKARAFGVLKEHHGQIGAGDLQCANVLALRDLSSPATIYAHAFDARVEFVASAFGNQALSRQSGRGNAFFWPSIVRVGDEAGRLSRGAAPGDRVSGLTNLKSHLPDCQMQADGWYFTNSGEAGPGARGQQVYGPLLQFLTKSGDIAAPDEEGNAQAALRPTFSRSSLTSLFFCEIVQQAIVQINSPYSRAHQPKVNAARQLNRIVVSRPAGWSTRECTALVERANAGVGLIWQAMGWAEQGPVTAPPRPSVELAIDEPLGAQTAYLYDQMAHKFPGPVQDYLSLKGKSRGESGAQSVLRIASMDMGAGAIGLTIATYSALGESRLRRAVQLRASVQTGGDDIVRAIVKRHIAPAVAARLSHLAPGGPGDGADILNEALLHDQDGKSAANILEEAALALLDDYEAGADRGPDRLIDTTLGLALAKRRRGGPSDAAANFDQMLSAKTNDPFSLMGCVLTLHASQISATISDVLRRPLLDLSAIVHALDCDICLASGRVSHLRDVSDALAQAAPVSAHKIVALRDYQPGNWYPTFNGAAQIGDAKTAPAMGVLVDLLADGYLQGFAIEDELRERGDRGAGGAAPTRRVIAIQADGKITPAHERDGSHVIILECDDALLPAGFSNGAAMTAPEQCANGDDDTGALKSGALEDEGPDNPDAEPLSPAATPDNEPRQPGDHRADSSTSPVPSNDTKGKIEVDARDVGTSNLSGELDDKVWADPKAVRFN